jgi:hypothetical protein
MVGDVRPNRETLHAATRNRQRAILRPSCLCVFVVNSPSSRERKSLARFETQRHRGAEGTENCSPLRLRVLCASAPLCLCAFSSSNSNRARNPSGRVARGPSLVCRARPSSCRWRFGFHHKGTKTGIEFAIACSPEERSPAMKRVSAPRRSAEGGARDASRRHRTPPRRARTPARCRARDTRSLPRAAPGGGQDRRDATADRD